MPVGKRDLTVGELVEYAKQIKWDGGNGDNAQMAEHALGRIGIKHSSEGGVLISNTADGVRRLLNGTPWSLNWAKVLRRLQGARAAGVKYFGFPGSETRATFVPL